MLNSKKHYLSTRNLVKNSVCRTKWSMSSRLTTCVLSSLAGTSSEVFSMTVTLWTWAASRATPSSVKSIKWYDHIELIKRSIYIWSAYLEMADYLRCWLILGEPPGGLVQDKPPFYARHIKSFYSHLWNEVVRTSTSISVSFYLLTQYYAYHTRKAREIQNIFDVNKVLIEFILWLSTSI